jgi:NADH dehydrogenase (ubiquinone) Fe-S protein 2
MNRSLFLNWNTKKNIKKDKSNNLILNFGPQHPAAHGVLRLILQLNGEIIERADIHIGLLHRATEKLIELKYYEKSIPYFDRLDYVSMMTQEHAYCLAIEQLQNIKNISINCSLQRILFDELTRLLNHFLAIACHALDVGSMSSIFWAFEEREKIMEFYERVSGARMHAAYHKPNELFSQTIDLKILNDITLFIKSCYITLNEMHNVLTYNKIWKQRLINIGTYGIKDAQNYGLTGIMLRCVGVKRDVRLSRKDVYSGYNTFNFKSYLSLNGDSYDRFLLRMFEMGESLNITNQCINKLVSLFNTTTKVNKELLVQPSKIEHFNSLILNSKKIKNINNIYIYMEDLIEHFCNWHSGIYIKNNLAILTIESPKGEFGVSIISNNSTKPFRCKIRSPSYHNLQMLPKLSKGHLLGDLATLIGTIDIVFGEIDR